MSFSPPKTHISQNHSAKADGVLLVGNVASAWSSYRAVMEDLGQRLQEKGWQVIQTSGKQAKVPRLLDMLQTAWRRRRDYRVAYVEVFSGSAFIWAEAACWMLRRVKRPYILTLHGGNLPIFAQSRPRRVGRLLRSAAIVTTPSRYLQQKMAPYRAGLLLLPNPLDLEGYEFRLRETPQPRLIWLRAFSSIYNPTLAMEVLALLAPDFPDLHLFMVGPDKGDGSFGATQEKAAQLNVSSHVTWPGGVPKAEVPQWLNKGDIFLNTTNIDNTPISIMEAMACGLCIVSTNVGGMPFLLDDGHDALLVPPGDASAMANAIRRVLTEPKLALTLSQNARRKVEGFDWAVILPQWEQILTAVSQGQTPTKEKNDSER